MTNYTNAYACIIITTTQYRRATQFFRKIYLSLYLKGFERVTRKFYCERELETEQNCNILTPTPMAIIVFLSCSPELLNREPGGPASLGHVPHSSIFSPTGLIFNCSIGGPEGSLCRVLVFSTASSLQQIELAVHRVI